MNSTVMYSTRRGIRRFRRFYSYKWKGCKHLHTSAPPQECKCMNYELPKQGKLLEMLIYNICEVEGQYIMKSDQPFKKYLVLNTRQSLGYHRNGNLKPLWKILGLVKSTMRALPLSSTGTGFHPLSLNLSSTHCIRSGTHSLPEFYGSRCKQTATLIIGSKWLLSNVPTLTNLTNVSLLL